MENFIFLLIPLLMLAGLIRVMLLPIRLAFKIGVNSICGFLCLLLLNSIAGFTGILFPINLVTVLIAGGLGLPGMALLALAQVIL